MPTVATASAGKRNSRSARDQHARRRLRALCLASPLALLATVFDQLGRYESAATIVGFALSPRTEMAYPELCTAITRLRDVLGDQTCESLTRKGATMTTSEMATYAYDQIDPASATPATDSFAFLQMLNNDGLVIYNVGAALNSGYQVCYNMDTYRGHDRHR